MYGGIVLFRFEKGFFLNFYMFFIIIINGSFLPTRKLLQQY